VAPRRLPPFVASFALHAAAIAALLAAGGRWADGEERRPVVLIVPPQEEAREVEEPPGPPAPPEAPARFEAPLDLPLEEIEVLDDWPRTELPLPAIGRSLPLVKVRRAAAPPPPPRPAEPATAPAARLAPSSAAVSTPARPAPEGRPVEYPERARRDRLQGRVVLRLLVGADGRVRGVEILESSGHPVLDDAASAAALAWSYLPAVEEGRFVESWVRVPVRFRLE